MPSFRQRIYSHRGAPIKALAACAFLTPLSPPGVANAARFEISLGDLIGPVPTRPGLRTFDFDFGREFESVEGLSIEVTASVTAIEFDVCGTFFDPQPCVHEVELWGFVGFIRTEEDDLAPNRFVPTERGLTFGGFRDLQGSGTDLVGFSAVFGFDFLLDGRATWTFGWNAVARNPDLIIRDVIRQSGEVSDARLMIDAVPIPEPSTGLLVALGFLLFGGRGLRSPRIGVRRRSDVSRYPIAVGQHPGPSRDVSSRRC